LLRAKKIVHLTKGDAGLDRDIAQLLVVIDDTIEATEIEQCAASLGGHTRSETPIASATDGVDLSGVSVGNSNGCFDLGHVGGSEDGYDPLRRRKRRRFCGFELTWFSDDILCPELRSPSGKRIEKSSLGASRGTHI